MLIGLRRRIASTPLAPLAALPVRAARVARHDATVIGRSARWLVTSREHQNYTYDLTRRNQEHLVWYLAAVTGGSPDVLRGYLREVTGDVALRRHIAAVSGRSERRGIADKEPRFGRRIGWYALVRHLKPRHVVESGVDKGLGSIVFAAALLRNAEDGAPGRLTALDINPAAGYLVREGPWASAVDLVFDDSLRSIPRLDRPVDLFLHDSDHSVRHEHAELAEVEPKLSPDAVLVTDNAATTDALMRHAEATGRRFLFFAEQPERHWYPGEGVGIAWRAR